MVKRCPPSGSGNSSEYELKPDISDDENDYEDIKSPRKKSKKSSTKAGPVSRSLTSTMKNISLTDEEGDTSKMDSC